ncbi:MAG: hypothetical protein P8075_06525 [Deltaproteobacteria bacterium]|jgi:hypothetical protein
MTRRRRWPNSSLFILLGCFGLLVGGCGKKGPPSPPRQEELPKVKNLQAVVVNRGVKLTWSIGSRDDIVTGFNVYRSKAQPEISDCPGCEKVFDAVSTIRVKAGETRFQLVDRHVEGKGRFYYKVTPFDQHNRPGPDSNESMVIIE